MSCGTATRFGDLPKEPPTLKSADANHHSGHQRHSCPFDRDTLGTLGCGQLEDDPVNCHKELGIAALKAH